MSIFLNGGERSRARTKIEKLLFPKVCFLSIQIGPNHPGVFSTKDSELIYSLLKALRSAPLIPIHNFLLMNGIDRQLLYYAAAVGCTNLVNFVNSYYHQILERPPRISTVLAVQKKLVIHCLTLMTFWTGFLVPSRPLR